MILQTQNAFFSWEILLLSIFLLPILWLVYKCVEERLSPLMKIPCPPGALPLVGHLFTLLRYGGVFEVMRSWTEQYAPMFIYHPGLGIGIGGYQLVIVDPELIRSAMVKNGHKFKRSDLVAKVVPSASKGLFSANGKAHSRQKRMIGPAFSAANLRGFLEVFQENTEKLVQLWSGQLKKLKQGQYFMDVEVIKDLSHLTLDVIGQSSFGYKFNTVLGGDSKVSEAFAFVLHQAFNFKYLVSTLLIPFFQYLPLAENRKLHSAREIADNTVLEVIQERHKRKREGNYVPVKKDLLDLLMDMYDEETDSRMDDEELRSQVFTFILAGNETTSVALAWTLYELAKNPHIQERMRSELLETFPGDDELTWEKLEKMQYMENVIKESLRLHSPGYLTNRVAISDVEIGGYFVPGGTVIILPMDAIQHSSHYWSNPEMFDPERFNEKDGQTGVQPFSYFPFGCGPRTCIGNKFAVMEMRVVLATLLKKFSFCEVPGCVVREVARGTAHPDGLKLRINLLE